MERKEKAADEVEYTLSGDSDSTPISVMIKLHKGGSTKYPFTFNRIEAGTALNLHSYFSNCGFKSFPTTFPPFVSADPSFMRVPVMFRRENCLTSLLKNNDFKEKLIQRHPDKTVFKPSNLYGRLVAGFVDALHSLANNPVKISIYKSLDHLYFFDHDCSQFLVFSHFRSYTSTSDTVMREYGTYLTYVINAINASFSPETKAIFDGQFAQILHILRQDTWLLDSFFKNPIFLSVDEQISLYYEISELITHKVEGVTYKNVHNVLRNTFWGWKKTIKTDQILHSIFERNELTDMDLDGNDHGLFPLLQSLRKVVCHFHKHTKQINFPHAHFQKVEEVVSYFNQKWPNHLASMVKFVSLESHYRASVA